MSGTDRTYHFEDTRRDEVQGGQTRSTRETKTANPSNVENARSNLPMPSEPPVASDFNSADQRTTGGMGSGRFSGPAGAGAEASAFREPTAAGSSAREDARETRRHTAPNDDVTSDPSRLAQPVKEGAGAVAADSLAAESVRDGGIFSENRDSQPLGVKGGNSTLATTDTSAARMVPPTLDAEARRAEAEWGSERLPKLNHLSGNEPTGTTAHSNVEGRSNTNKSADPNPAASTGTGVSKPKGKNLTEGGFDDDPANNASFTSEIGSKDDPSRQAEKRMDSKPPRNMEEYVDAVHQAAYMPVGSHRKEGQPYEALGSEKEA
ncbi:hypothetical protein FQN57_003091 [Myotisia sp. PD_48]|nr:hypothetical protein FQN57_003091 [Myotisia sp. PD_48]